MSPLYTSILFNNFQVLSQKSQNSHTNLNQMASESATTETQSFIENLNNSRNTNMSLFLPFILALSNSTTQQIQDSTTPHENLERIILVNPITQGMVVIQNHSSTNFESFINDVLSKQGQPPASKSSIEALPSVEGKEECVICLEEWGIGKEMPCKHRFHKECIEKWLNIHGTCPVCRYKMPEEESDLNNKSENRERRREIWMSFSLGNDRTSEENDHTDNDHDHAPEV